MMVELVGYLFRVLARLRPGDRGRYLDHIGRELIRLGRPHP
jgi:hypothetical protein